MWDIDKNIKCGSNVEEVVETEDCKAMRLHDESGDGLMTLYCVFPGVFLMYNDFHMDSCISNFKSNIELFCIDHCKEGRLEHKMSNEMYCYLQVGDLRIDRRIHHSGRNVFPLSHYHGISIIFQIGIAEKEISKLLNGFSVKLSNLQEKYCKNMFPYIIPGEKEIEHIFSELYNVPAKIKRDYYKIKVLELLLYLDALELPKHKDERPYFYKSQVEKIKAIHALLASDLTANYTIESLSKQFDIATTPLKNCFKSIYGEPIFTYMRKFKMNYAANLLKTNKDLKIIDIAGMIGYSSPSKFAVTFKSIMGKTPLEYRKSFV